MTETTLGLEEIKRRVPEDGTARSESHRGMGHDPTGVARHGADGRVLRW